MNNFLNTIKSGFVFTGGHYTQTFITEFFVLISGLLVYKLAALNFPKVGFAEYALCRRTISLVHPVLLLGFAVGIPRFIAIEKFSEKSNKQGTFFISGVLISVIFSLFILLIGYYLKELISQLIFGEAGMSYLIFPLSVMIFGLVIHSLCYSYFRGKLWIGSANIIQFLIIALIPIVVLLFQLSLYNTILLTGVSSLFLSSIILIALLYNLKWSKNEIKSCAKQLLNYGLQRIPGDLFLAAFFALPAFIVANQIGKLEGGYVAFAITLISLAGTSFGPISMLLLPKSAELIASDNFEKLKSEVTKIVKIVLIITVLGIVIFEFFAAEILDLYLGNKFHDMILVTRVMILGALGYSLYISLRSVLDAYHIKAVNTINIIFSFFLFLAFTLINYFANFGYLFIIIAFVFSISILGILTYFEYKKLLSVSILKNNK